MGNIIPDLALTRIWMCSLDSGSEGEEAGRTREAHSSEHVSEDEALVEVMLPRIPLSFCEHLGTNHTRDSARYNRRMTLSNLAFSPDLFRLTSPPRFLPPPPHLKHSTSQPTRRRRASIKNLIHCLNKVLVFRLQTLDPLHNNSACMSPAPSLSGRMRRIADSELMRI